METYFKVLETFSPSMTVVSKKKKIKKNKISFYHNSHEDALSLKIEFHRIIPSGKWVIAQYVLKINWNMNRNWLRNASKKNCGKA